MERGEYERMHAVEDRMWWYRGLRLLAAGEFARALARSPTGGPVLDLEPNDGTFACQLDPPRQCLFRNDGYVDANAGFAVRLPLGVEIYGRLNNFLNQRYDEAFGFPALRLNFVSGIKLELPSRHASPDL